MGSFPTIFHARLKVIAAAVLRSLLFSIFQFQFFCTSKYHAAGATYCTTKNCPDSTKTTIRLISKCTPSSPHAPFAFSRSDSGKFKWCFDFSRWSDQRFSFHGYRVVRTSLPHSSCLRGAMLETHFRRCKKFVCHHPLILQGLCGYFSEWRCEKKLNEINPPM